MLFRAGYPESSHETVELGAIILSNKWNNFSNFSCRNNIEPLDKRKAVISSNVSG